MKCEAIGDRLVLQRSPAELLPFKQRLSRIEGQVRGLKQMIEDNRYCGEAIQQSNAVIAAIREVALMLISQQLQTHAEQMQITPVGAEAAGTDKLAGFVDLLRTTYRLQ